ncbi:hypothetical protein EW026_g3421 [Hermanssonia centrifuga]|uniref:Peptidase A1 domain-containing protein n=1 Tax=Hermanssonia centrifuga TaxID=98765 RepID=A0A4S4KKR6_9APHY|nr:hypothetical protein EW026_g3421 [Hermanssonia centrifuga]
MKSHIVPFRLLILTSFLAFPINFAEAVRLGLQGKHIHPIRGGLNRRASLTGTTSLNDTQDINYTTNITLGGNQFAVIIDTGSADFYVTGTVPGSVDTGKTASVQYAIGSVEGPIKLATLDFAGYTVENQAYIDVPEANSSKSVGTGLIGLGPHYDSEIHYQLGNSSGDTVLDRIFQQNTSTPNYITILLGRDDDPSGIFPGDLTIGEILPGYEAITAQPQLNVTQVSIVNNTGNQHWQTLLDADGIIGPNGKVIDISTVVSSTSNKKQLTAIFDSGFSLPQVPMSVYVSEAIYGDVSEINISFNLGGKNFPVHPLDTSLDLNETDNLGNRICFGAFQPIIPTATSPNADMILGMAFLRNAYLYINFGDFIDGKTNDTADPYIQLLSTTNDSSKARSEFVEARGYPKYRGSSALTWILSHLSLVVGLAATLLVLITAAIVFCCVRSRRNRNPPVSSAAGLNSPYNLIHDSVPSSHDAAVVDGQGYARQLHEEKYVTP